MRSVALSFQVGDKAIGRLNGRNYKFKPYNVEVFTSPLVCLESTMYNTINVLGSVPNMDCNRASVADNAIIVQAYTGDKLNLSAVFDRFPDCDRSLVSSPQHGHISNSNWIVYECNNQYFTGSDNLWFLSRCIDNIHNLIPLNILYTQASIYADTAVLKIVGPSTTVTSENIEIGRTASDFSIPTDILLSLTAQDPHGNLTLNGVNLQPADSFTQQDVASGRLDFRIHDASKAFESRLTLTAESPGAPPLEFPLLLAYTPQLYVNVSMIDVVEGGFTVITGSHLHVKYGVVDTDSFLFNVSGPPKFGSLVDPETGSVLTTFSSSLLLSERLKYVHDGSESVSDEITLNVQSVNTPVIEDIVDIPIAVTLVNDNAPVRNTSETIQVVRHKDTHLTNRDLSYTDIDINQTPGDIHIERRGIFCGELIDILSLSPVFKFSQADIDSGHMVFRHSGEEENCNLVIWVSDGKHLFSEVLEIETVEHSYQIGGSHQISIDRGGQTTLNTTVFNISSNTHTNPNNIIISLSRYPQHGSIIGPADSGHTFTYQDIIDGNVQFVHLGTISISDNFRILIEFDGITVTENIDVLVRTDPDLLKPVIESNLAVAGSPGSIVMIDNDILNVYHPLADASDIIYQIPDQNVDTRFRKQLTSGAVEARFSFTQQEIDEKCIYYRIGAASKDFTILVSFNSISTDLVFRSISLTANLQVVPASPINVAEGGQITLVPAVFAPQEPMLQNPKLRINIITPPLNGALYKNLTVPVHSFSWTELTNGLISYQHDSSETTSDSWRFRLTYASDNIRSDITEQQVLVQPVNDHLPTFNQTGKLKTLIAWSGEYDL